MAFDIPRGRMLRIDRATISVVNQPHPYERAHGAEIEALWQTEKAANPRYFDGTVVLFSDVAWRGGVLRATCHPIRFATYLHWRKHRADATAEHMYAHAMPVTADGALIAIRMSAGTANAGRVYFAAGSFDMSDVVDGQIDIDGNMVREVAEETGIDLNSVRRDAAWHGWSSERGTVIVRRFHLNEDAETVARRIRDFVAADPDPEIEGPVVIRRADDLPDGLMPHMTPLIDWHFSTASD